MVISVSARASQTRASARSITEKYRQLSSASMETIGSSALATLLSRSRSDNQTNSVWWREDRFTSFKHPETE
jgi:hypothetical protein